MGITTNIFGESLKDEEIARIKGERADVFYFYKRRYNVTGIPDPVIY